MRGIILLLILLIPGSAFSEKNYDAKTEVVPWVTPNNSEITQNTTVTTDPEAKEKEKVIKLPSNVKDILKAIDKTMRGETSYGEYEMVVTLPSRKSRTIKMQSWSQGTENFFIKILYPLRDKGVTFLKLGNEMWQYVPKIERVIKIPPSMMMQSWMGSDFTNDDLVKEASIVDDYNGKILENNNSNWKIELMPKPEAAVTWDKVIVWIDKKTMLPTTEEFYDEDGVLVRVMTFSEVKRLPDRYYPFKMVIEPRTEDKEGHITTFITKKISFNEPVNPKIFSLGSLKSMSK